MTNREKQILALLKRNALIQQQEIAECLGISRSAVAGHIMGLVNKGYVKGRGYILTEHHYSRSRAGAGHMDGCPCVATSLAIRGRKDALCSE